MAETVRNEGVGPALQGFGEALDAVLAAEPAFDEVIGRLRPMKA